MPQPVCPTCFSGFVKRSRRRNAIERFLSLVSIYPYRCQLCQHRFSRHQKGLKYQRIDEDRREYERLPVHLAATFAIGKVRGQGEVLDISMAGCSLRTETLLNVGDTIYFTLLRPGQVAAISVEVAILRGLFPSGARLEFLRFDGDEREKLQRFMRELIAEHSSGKPQGTEPLQG